MKKEVEGVCQESAKELHWIVLYVIHLNSLLDLWNLLKLYFFYKVKSILVSFLFIKQNSIASSISFSNFLSKFIIFFLSKQH